MEEHKLIEGGKNEDMLVKQMDLILKGLICQRQGKYWVLDA